MKKSILIVLTILIACSKANALQLDQSEPGPRDYGYWFERDVVQWQEFRPTLPILEEFDILLLRWGYPGDVVVEIKDEAGKILWNTTIPESSIPQQPVQYILSTWITIDTPAINLTVDQSYYIYVSSTQPSPEVENRYFWDGVGLTRTSAYTRGTSSVGACVDPIVVGCLPGYNFCFKTWGYDLTGDEDGDGLLNGWETNGIDTNNDGQLELDLPAMGADPQHKDIFVEVDYMVDSSTSGHSHALKAEALKKIIDAFGNAPVSNPDGTNGIHLHVDAGPSSIMNPVTNATWGALSKSESLTHVATLGSEVPPTGSGNYSWSDFDAIKNQHFSTIRRPAFHYCIFAHNLPTLANRSGISGISRGIPAGDFIVSLGSWTNNVGTVLEQAGTFMHELGHNLSLRHGGDNHENWKPNFLSIMNYSFQTRGLRINGLDGNFDYSIMDLPNLNENNLNESLGLGSDASMNSYGTIFFSGGQHIVNKINDPIDWNNNGISNEVSVNIDINRDGSQTVLTSYDDWDNLVFNGGSIGDLGVGYTPTDESPAEELTKEDDDNLITLVGVSIDGHGIVQAGVGVSIIRTFTIKNIGEYDDNYLITANSSKGWSIVSTIPSYANLDSQEEITFPVTVEVPQIEMLGEEEKLTITVISQTNPNVLDSSELLIRVVDSTPSDVTVIQPEANVAVQDGITLTADANDADGVEKVYFYIREPNDGNGVPIGMEELAATLNASTGKWEYNFDTTVLQDGYYVAIAKAVDTYGNVGWSEPVPFSIRNWAIITMLPSTPNSNPGRTMPVKFSLRISNSVDPAMPFVYNDELEIRIYTSGAPTNILQSSFFGPSSTDYRIDTVIEMYITNFKTERRRPATYVVEIWRPTKSFMVGSFTFKTVK